MTAPQTLRLILGDQLNHQHHWFARPSAQVVYTLMEVRQETDYVAHHIQKVAAFFAAMRQFADDLARRGHRVIYLRLDDPDNTHSIPENLQRLIDRERIERVEYLLPDEYRLDQQLAAFAEASPLPAEAVDTAHFLTKREAVAQQFAGKKRFLMESFYREMRKTHDILIDEGKPRGGRWNYDHSNRSRYDEAVPLPEPLLQENDVRDIVAMIEACGVKTIGRIAPQRLIWPVNREQALAQLNDFLRHRLPHFGTYQDAMTGASWHLYHSLLSFALNTKLLHPMEVIEGALHRMAAADLDIAQVEGFVRQILGWREFVRGIYWAHMPQYGEMNHFDHRRPLPDWYWTAETRMACLRAAIDQSLEHAYAHHIQRLMLTGNFALLAGIQPEAVDAWYLGIYIDAIEWVELVNTRGMSQFADGGIVATKPYAASANYIRKMSDYCGRCHYQATLRFGEGACPFNSLYWDFLHRRRPLLEGNPRMATMYRTWERMSAENQRGLLDQAEQYLANLNAL